MKDVYSDALKIILAKRRTRKEVTGLLIKKGYDEQDARDAAEYYAEKEYIDEKDYALRFAHDAAKIKGYGAHRIRMQLKEKGVPEEYINEALSQTEFDLQKQIIKKYGDSGKYTFKEKQKIINHFTRKGFSPGRVQEEVNNLYETEEDL